MIVSRWRAGACCASNSGASRAGGFRPGLVALGLSDQESWDLLGELARSLRQQGAVTMPEGVDPRDEHFDPRRGPIYVRAEGG